MQGHVSIDQLLSWAAVHGDAETLDRIQILLRPYAAAAGIRAGYEGPVPRWSERYMKDAVRVVERVVGQRYPQ